MLIVGKNNKTPAKRISILRGYRDCTQRALDTGENVGICDEVKSVYVCDFFVRQFMQFLGRVFKGGVSVFSAVREAQSGGGEYLDMENAFKNAEESERYFVERYAEGSKLAEGFKDSSYVATEFCKTGIAQTYPTDFDAMLSPESLYQPE